VCVRVREPSSQSQSLLPVAASTYTAAVARLSTRVGDAHACGEKVCSLAARRVQTDGVVDEGHATGPAEVSRACRAVQSAGASRLPAQRRSSFPFGLD
jgi:hypothetical protein